ncbi:MAG: LPS export ABC transporter periplasmic protein LptC [Bdellovibrionales bacterium]
MIAFTALKARKAEQPAQVVDLATWWNAPTRKVMRVTSKPREWLRTVKFALPAAGVVLLIAAFIWPSMLPSLPSMGIKLGELAKEVGMEAAMFDLNYQGVNKQGQPFAVTAAKAVRDIGAENPTVTLTEPQADFTTKEGAFLAMTADQGIYREKQNALNLQGNVEIFHDNGSTFSSPQLAVDFTQNRAWTDTPVNVHGPFGTIDAEQGMIVEEGGKKVIFKGPTKARLTGEDPKQQP